jgi:cytochrome c oxidase cbb3-type subunit I/II
LVGGILEIVPTLMIKSNIPTISTVKPYTPLELEGRDIYIREACNACHSQMVRTLPTEVLRYDPSGKLYSLGGEFVYDHPFLWGSKRTGPDLAREGGRYPHSWHYHHLWDPSSMSPGSIMPRYPWLFGQGDPSAARVDTRGIAAKLVVMQRLGVPYSEADIAGAESALLLQGNQIAMELNQDSALQVRPDEEIVALIAYLQRLGQDIRKAPADEIKILMKQQSKPQ